MGSMDMSMSHGGPRDVDRGMSMSAAHGATNILPAWLAVIWTLVFIAIIVIHARHVLDSDGQRRIWHSGHVLMAFGMAFMFAPASIDHFNIPSGFWQLAFANGAIAILAWMLAQALTRQRDQRAVAGDGDRPRGDGLHVVAERIPGADDLAAGGLVRRAVGCCG